MLAAALPSRSRRGERADGRRAARLHDAGRRRDDVAGSRAERPALGCSGCLDAGDAPWWSCRSLRARSAAALAGAKAASIGAPFNAQRSANRRRRRVTTRRYDNAHLTLDQSRVSRAASRRAVCRPAVPAAASCGAVEAGRSGSPSIAEGRMPPKIAREPRSWEAIRKGQHFAGPAQAGRPRVGGAMRAIRLKRTKRPRLRRRRLRVSVWRLLSPRALTRLHRLRALLYELDEDHTTKERAMARSNEGKETR